eukprot:12780348-Alexandrium_andersonii.AAC.1
MAKRFVFEPLVDSSSDAMSYVDRKCRFILSVSRGAPVNVGASAYDRAVLHCGDSGCYGFPEF